ncbi:hypothetical protein Caci_2846 [Catenulispora acidiphila DSM 44928]|uniref:Uncharacterized protein n=1 Tax=Catenulispora acidiphila (strain DSM 44928 / JCM 14897 / NBRC 102108 / NRRL B-24433 / ID139908) TaxID=479433 RepID=C7Q180_CATAD|nr:hypothetical protein [Catenulispora acidiphila]ACU71755.1 hypothetical protein Caci_2846 [Catenulispora acidiphila DSM 44928]
MSVTEPAYVTREAVKKALDVKGTARSDDDIDRSIQAASRAVEGQLHRKFYPRDMTRFWDWPSYQYALPWRIWLDAWELAAIPTSVTTGGQTIPLGNLFFEPANSGPPYTSMEINRSTNSAFGAGPTPQRDVTVTGTFGFNLDSTGAGALAAGVSDTTDTSVTVTNGAAAGVGDVLLVDTERMLLTDKAMASTGQTQSGAGCASASNADSILTPSGGTFYVGETLLLDAERMLVVDKAGATVIVKRAWDGTTLATHASATIYAARSWTVTRGALGTTASTHSSATAVSRYTPPSLVTQLSLAEAENNLLQGISGYARTVGSADNARPVSGQALADIRAQAYAQYGRKARRRTV